MASKKTEQAVVAQEESSEAIVPVAEDEKLDIEDILDPEDSNEPVVQDAPTEPSVEAEEVEETPETKEARPKKNFFGMKEKRNKPQKEKAKEEEAKAAKIKEEDFFKPVSKDEPLLVTKKRSIFGTILTILLTMILTAAAILGGLFYYTKYYNQPKESQGSKIEETIAESETATKKTVFVDSEVGLFLRKEPSVLSEKITIIPNGTKLTVIEENGEWLKVEFNGTEGWVAKEFTTEKNPYEYKNEQYGFMVPVPTDWKGFKVFETSSEGAVAGFAFALPTTDKSWKDISGVSAGYASKFVLTVYTKEQFEASQAQEGPKPSKAAESSKYVFAVMPANAGPADQSEISAINYKNITTF